MIIFPAVDIQDGKAVRLRQGRADESTIFSPDPVAAARHWQEQGARWLHVVDLDGAFDGQPKSRDIVRGICAALLREHAPLEVIDKYLIPALNAVGDEYEKGTLFLPQLIAAAESAKGCFAEVKKMRQYNSTLTPTYEEQLGSLYHHYVERMGYKE